MFFSFQLQSCNEIAISQSYLFFHTVKIVSSKVNSWSYVKIEYPRNKSINFARRLVETNPEVNIGHSQKVVFQKKFNKQLAVIIFFNWAAVLLRFDVLI